MGKGLGNTKNLRNFSCQACNLYEGKNLAVLLKDMVNNTSIETLDFSDNDLSDKHGEVILSLIKHSSESRDDQLFWASLRQEKPEKYLQSQVQTMNEQEPYAGTQREINSSTQIKKLLANLDNADMQTQDAVLEQQAHVVNYKKQRILYAAGLRELILMRNRFADGFAKDLKNAILFDKYLKMINISGN